MTTTTDTITLPMTESDLYALLRCTQEKLRQNLAQLEEMKGRLSTALSLLAPSLDPLRADVKTAKEAVDEVEQTLLEGITLYHTVTTAREVPQIGKVTQHELLTYDPGEALQWALAHHMFVQLDTAAFEAYCKSQKDSNLPPCVTRTMYWKPQINRKALAE